MTYIQRQNTGSVYTWALDYSILAFRRLIYTKVGGQKNRQSSKRTEFREGERYYREGNKKGRYSKVGFGLH